MTIAPAASATELLAARRLFEEYAATLAFDLCFQNFAHELATLPGEYAPPGGRLWLATAGDDLAGCVALRRLGPGVGEMKRLYVRPAHRGTGLGRRLVETVVAGAAVAGYDRLRLDTAPDMTAALRLYESAGFARIPPYRPNPVPGAVYLERRLRPAGRRSLAAVALVVRDYDEAIRFFTDALGFVLVEDTPLSPGKRWVTVGPPGGGAAVLLARAATPAEAARVGDQTGGRVFLFLRTDDFWRDYHAFRARGVRFTEEPREEGYGTVAVFLDLYGNRWDLVGGG